MKYIRIPYELAIPLLLCLAVIAFTRSTDTPLSGCLFAPYSGHVVNACVGVGSG